MNTDTNEAASQKVLKFDHGPTTTLALAQKAGTLAATIRYDDEKNITEGDSLAIRHPHSEDTIGTATVEHTETVPARRALDVVTIHWAEYGIQTPDELISRLNDYYDTTIDMTTEVKVLIIDPKLNPEEIESTHTEGKNGESAW